MAGRKGSTAHARLPPERFNGAQRLRSDIASDPSTGRSAVIIATAVELLEPLVVRAGYEVVGACDTGVYGERLVAYWKPDVVVVENDLRGDPGWSVLGRLREVSPASQVLLVVTDDWTPHDLGSTGAFAVVTRGRLGELVEELTDLDEWIRTAETSTLPHGERRTHHDRRVHQDWSKVGWERRSKVRRGVDATA